MNNPNIPSDKMQGESKFLDQVYGMMGSSTNQMLEQINNPSGLNKALGRVVNLPYRILESGFNWAGDILGGLGTAAEGLFTLNPNKFFSGALQAGGSFLGAGGYVAEGTLKGLGVENQGVLDTANFLGGFAGGGTMLKVGGKALKYGDEALKLGSGTSKGATAAAGAGALSKTTGLGSYTGSAFGGIGGAGSSISGLDKLKKTSTGLSAGSGLGRANTIGGAGGAAGAMTRGERLKEAGLAAAGAMFGGGGGVNNYIRKDETDIDRLISSSTTKASTSMITNNSSKSSSNMKEIEHMMLEKGMMHNDPSHADVAKVPPINKSPVKIKMKRPSNI